MPTYQYACTACGHRFEAVQAFTDASLSECPECTGRLRKVYGSVGVVFKGSGFYRTDSRAEAKSKSKSTVSAGNESSSTSSTSSTSDSGTSSKSESGTSASKSTSSTSTTSTTTAKAS